MSIEARVSHLKQVQKAMIHVCEFVGATSEKLTTGVVLTSTGKIKKLLNDYNDELYDVLFKFMGEKLGNSATLSCSYFNTHLGKNPLMLDLKVCIMHKADANGVHGCSYYRRRIMVGEINAVGCVENLFTFQQMKDWAPNHLINQSLAPGKLAKNITRAQELKEQAKELIRQIPEELITDEYLNRF